MKDGTKKVLIQKKKKNDFDFERWVGGIFVFVSVLYSELIEIETNIVKLKKKLFWSKSLRKSNELLTNITKIGETKLKL